MKKQEKDTHLQSPVNPLLPTRPTSNLPTFKTLLKQLIRSRLGNRIMQIRTNFRRRIRSILLHEVIEDETCGDGVVRGGLGFGFFLWRHDRRWS